jgi:hypothetical protein
MLKPMEIPTDALALGDRFCFDEDLTPIDRMCRSTRRAAVAKRGYPKPRRIGLRSAWLLSEVLAWMRSQPPADETDRQRRNKRKALSPRIEALRASASGAGVA